MWGVALQKLVNRNVYGMVALALMSGCTTVPRDLGRSEVDSLVLQRGWPTADAMAPEVEVLLAEPLDAEAVAQVALLNSPRLQHEIAELGFGAAEVYEAGRLSNPRFAGSWLDSEVSSAAGIAAFANAVGNMASEGLHAPVITINRSEQGAANKRRIVILIAVDDSPALKPCQLVQYDG